MAKLYITEHKNPRFIGGNALPVLENPPLASQVVVIGGTSNQSLEFGPDTKILCVHTDSTCSIEFGSDPTATANSRRLVANSTEFFDVSRGHKIAVITNT